MQRRIAAAVATVALVAGGALAQTPPRALDRAHVPSGHGWFCFEDPLPRGGSTFMCDRPTRACEHLRSVRRAAGESVGGCVASPVAYCVTYVDHTEAHPSTHHACTRESAQCAALHGELEASNHDGEVYAQLSACTEVH